MTTRSELTQAIHDELVGVMDARDDTSSGNSHVVLDDEDLPESPPALSVLYAETPSTSGSAHDTRVVEYIENADGETIDVRYADEKTMEATVTCLAKSDATAVSTYEDVRQHFNGFDRARDPSDLAPHVDDVTCEDASPQTSDGRRGHILRVTVEYEERYTYGDVVGEQFTPTRSVDATVEAVADTTSFTTD